VAAACVFLAALPPGARRNENSDYYDDYLPRAEAINAGEGIFAGGVAPRVGPAYPFYLAAVLRVAAAVGTAPERLVVTANVGWAALAAVAIASWGAAALGRRAGRVAGILWVTYPPALWLLKQPNSDVPALSCLAAALGLFAVGFRDGKWAAGAGAGLALAAATLTRPGTALLVVLLAGAAAFWPGLTGRRRLGFAAATVAAFLVPVLLYGVAARQATGDFAWWAPGGVKSAADGFSWGWAEGPTARDAVPADVKAVMTRLGERAGLFRDLGDVYGALAAEFRRAPGAVLKLLGLKAARAWFGTASCRAEGAAAAVQAVYVIAGVIGFVVAGRRVRTRPMVYVMVGWVLCFYLGVVAGAVPLMRYMVPAMLALVVGAAAALDEGWGAWARRRAARLAGLR
jgi:4-amino-4-deoxy-L-arabinose transferase-like glycosyltransferase